MQTLIHSQSHAHTHMHAFISLFNTYQASTKLKALNNVGNKKELFIVPIFKGSQDFIGDIAHRQ